MLYRRGWNGLSVSFGRFFLNSLVISVLVVVGNLISCSMAAYAFTRLRFARDATSGSRSMLGTLMMPQHAVLIPQYVLFLKLGWVNTILPLVVPKFLAIDAFFIFLMVQFFRGIPRELDEAAIMDGAGPLRIYPQGHPAALDARAGDGSNLLLHLDLGRFLRAADLSERHARSYTVQLGLRTFVDASAQSDWSALLRHVDADGAAIFVLFILFQRLLIEGIATTGMKR